MIILIWFIFDYDILIIIMWSRWSLNGESELGKGLNCLLIKKNIVSIIGKGSMKFIYRRIVLCCLIYL